MSNSKKKYGFTLIELLVVVIIIAVLAAVAVPQYKKAVLKSRFTTVMPMAKAVADAQEVYFLGNGQYALYKTDLDITPMNVENTEVELSTEQEEDNYNYVVAKRTDFPNARYIIYQKHSPKFASNIHCEADETNEDALWLCEKGLNGTEIPGSINTAEGDYKTFLLAGNIGTDQLPTSLNKLAASLCAGKENCTYTINGDTVTTKECGDRSFMSSMTQGWSYSADLRDQGCINTTYNANGNVEEKVYEYCHRQEDGTCTIPTTMSNTGRTAYYKEVYDLNRNRIETKACGQLVDGVCNMGYNAYVKPDGTRVERNVYCKRGVALSADGNSCSGEYEINAGRALAETYYDSSYNEIGRIKALPNNGKWKIYVNGSYTEECPNADFNIETLTCSN